MLTKWLRKTNEKDPQIHSRILICCSENSASNKNLNILNEKVNSWRISELFNKPLKKAQTIKLTMKLSTFAWRFCDECLSTWKLQWKLLVNFICNKSLVKFWWNLFCYLTSFALFFFSSKLQATTSSAFSYWKYWKNLISQASQQELRETEIVFEFPVNNWKISATFHFWCGIIRGMTKRVKEWEKGVWEMTMKLLKVGGA